MKLLGDIGRKAGGTFAGHRSNMPMCQSETCRAVCVRW